MVLCQNFQHRTENENRNRDEIGLLGFTCSLLPCAFQPLVSFASHSFIQVLFTIQQLTIHPMLHREMNTSTASINSTAGAGTGAKGVRFSTFVMTIPPVTIANTGGTPNTPSKEIGSADDTWITEEESCKSQMHLKETIMLMRRNNGEIPCDLKDEYTFRGLEAMTNAAHFQHTLATKKRVIQAVLDEQDRRDRAYYRTSGVSNSPKTADSEEVLAELSRSISQEARNRALAQANSDANLDFSD